MKAMITSLDATQLAKAKLTQSYTDVFLGPGKDGGSPDTKSGIKGRRPHRRPRSSCSRR